MNGKWVTKSLGEVIVLQRGHDLPSQVRSHGQIPIMGSAGVTGYHDKIKEKGPGVVIGRSGNSMGGVHFTEQDYWPLNTCLYVTEFKGNDERFIYYFLKTINFDQFNSGSAQKSLNRNAVYPFRVFIPTSIDEQKQIAKILSDLEDKITLNRQINQTLEAMAQALFKSWFVDFEPVRAKVAALELGKDPNRAAMRTISGKTDVELDNFQNADANGYAQLHATASLFPNELVDSDLGLVPEGWEVERVENIFELAYGRALKSTDRIPGEFPVYGSGGITGNHNKSIVKGPSIIVGRKGTVGSLYYEAKDFFPIDTVFYVIPKDGISLLYCWYILSNLGLENMNTDAAVPGLNRNNVYRLLAVVPSYQILDAYTKQVGTIYDMITERAKESNQLAIMRDTLLPKLLSGELAVGETVGAGLAPAL